MRFHRGAGQSAGPTAWVGRIAVGAIAFLVVLATGGWAWAAGPYDVPVLAFDGSTQATLMLPSPACPVTSPACQWMLFVNEPLLSGQPFVGKAFATYGTIAVAEPADFCGVVQADALRQVAPGQPWVYQTGIRTTISTCTTVTPPAPPTSPAPPSNTATVPPPIGSTTTGQTTPPKTSSLPFTGGAGSATPIETTSLSSASPSQLPFTGANLPPMVILGLTSIALGALLADLDRNRWLRRLGHAAVNNGPARRIGQLVSWVVGR